MLFDTVLIESIPAPTIFVILNHGLGKVIYPFSGIIALCALKGKKASLNFECSQNVYMLQAACCVPASIAFGHPNTDLLG